MESSQNKKRKARAYLDPKTGRESQLSPSPDRSPNMDINYDSFQANEDLKTSDHQSSVFGASFGVTPRQV